MQCWYPITVSRHHNYKGKDGLLYTRVYGKMSVPCGRCPACRKRKQNEWAYRILEETKVSLKTAFVTLTYDDDNLVYSDSGIPTLFPDHITTFCKDLRYNLKYKDSDGNVKSFRFFLCGEYGDQFDRPHYHFLLFYNGSLSHDELKSYIEKRWSYGFIEYDPHITAGRAKYCAKYSMKSIGFDYQDVVPPFARMSRRPGIGKLFLDHINFDTFRMRDIWHVHDYQGVPYPLPRYYRERIYSKDECYQHSLLLEKIINSKFDYLLSTKSDSDNIYEFISQKIRHQEQLFIKHLKKENYGFKYKPKSSKTYRSVDHSDLVTDEF